MTLPLMWQVVVAFAGQSQSPSSPAAACTVEMAMTGTIGPASLDFLSKALRKTKSENCNSLLITINTPGGSLQSTRLIVEEILNSPVPVLCLVYPSGGHAGSAGAIILQACHVNGAMVATNLGAATPIASTGEEMPEDLRKKLLNDTTSWLDGITKLRGRNEEFGRQIITEAKAVSAKEAQEIGAIDFVAEKKMDFLNFAQGRKVMMTENAQQTVEVGDLIKIEPTLRDKVLQLVTDPQIAYLLFMGSLALLYFEITHPGTMVAGVVGGIGLVLSMIALHKLEVQYGGLLLLLLGVALMIAEAFVASFGILGIGGVVAFIVGSLFLFDPVATGGYQLPLTLIFTTSILLGSLMIGVAYLAFKTRNVRRKGSYDDLIGEEARVVVVSDDQMSGQIELFGETWRFECAEPVQEGQKVVVKDYKGLTLKVVPK